MAPGLRILERASRGMHDALFGEWGILTTGIGTQEVKARVNRNVKQSGAKWPIDIMPDSASVLWFSKTLAQPKQDYVFTDESGFQHTLTHNANDLGHAWEVLCRVSK